jgi:hypothetical protein
LKARVQELEREVRNLRAGAGATLSSEREKQLMEKGAREARAAAESYRRKLISAVTRVLSQTEALSATLPPLRALLEQPAVESVPTQVPPQLPKRAAAGPPVAAPRRPAREPSHAGEERLGAGERAILNFLAMRANSDFSKEQVGAMTGYAAGGGSFNTYVSRLSTAGLIERRGARLRLADGALERAVALLGDDYQPGDKFGLEGWLEKLGKGPRQIYELVLANPEQLFSKSDLAERAGYEAGGGSFNTYLSRLATLGLIERTPDGIRLNPELQDL